MWVAPRRCGLRIHGDRGGMRLQRKTCVFLKVGVIGRGGTTPPASPPSISVGTQGLVSWCCRDVEIEQACQQIHTFSHVRSWFRCHTRPAQAHAAEILRGHDPVLPLDGLICFVVCSELVFVQARGPVRTVKGFIAWTLLSYEEGSCHETPWSDLPHCGLVRPPNRDVGPQSVLRAARA